MNAWVNPEISVGYSLNEYSILHAPTRIKPSLPLPVDLTSEGDYLGHDNSTLRNRILYLMKQPSYNYEDAEEVLKCEPLAKSFDPVVRKAYEAYRNRARDYYQARPDSYASTHLTAEERRALRM